MNKSRLKLLTKKARDKMKRRTETRIAFPNLFLTFCIKKKTTSGRKERPAIDPSFLKKKKSKTQCV